MLGLMTLAACKKSGSSLPGTSGNRPLQADYLQTPAAAFNTLFTRHTGGTWTGGDINYSIPLPNGEEFWPMGDSFIDSVTPARVHTQPGLLSSTIFLSNGQGSTTPTYAGTLYNVSGGFPIPYYPPVDDSTRRWSKDGIYLNGHIYAAIFVNRAIAGTGGLGVKIVETDWADISYPGFTINHIYRGGTSGGSLSTTVIWGSSVTTDNTYIYIYGAEPVTQAGLSFSYMHLARVSKSTPTAAWQYYSGNGTTNTWSGSYSASTRLKTGTTTLSDLGGLSTEYTIFKNTGDSKYYLINQSSLLFSDTVYRYRSTSIYGPWTDRKVIAVASYPAGHTSGDGEFTYDAKAHPEFTNPSEAGDLLISNDVNNTSITKVDNNADLYRPYFNWVAGVVWSTN